MALPANAVLGAKAAPPTLTFLSPARPLGGGHPLLCLQGGHACAASPVYVLIKETC